MSLTPAQTDLIKATIPILKQHGDTISTVFYRNMLEAHPDLNSVFNTTNQVTGHQPRALAGALLAYATHIDNPSVLGPTIELICNKHASLYIRPDQYEIVGTHLLGGMKQVLGDALTPEIHDAWAAAYWQLAHLLIGREEQLYKTANEHGHWSDWRSFRIVRKQPESTEITSFYLSPVDEEKQQLLPLPSFKPGQYIGVQTHVPTLSYPQARQYSLSDSPHPDYYRISVKKESGVNPHNPSDIRHPGYVSNVLHDLYKEGDTLRVAHPFGDFHLSDSTISSSSSPSTPNPIVLISAGVGLTPLTSMLNTLTAPDARVHNSKRKIHFIHGVRTANARAFPDHFRSLQRSSPETVRVTFFNSAPAKGEREGVDYDRVGRIDLEQLDRERDLFLGDASTEYYVCGPAGFMLSIEEALKGLGVGGDRILMEVFGTGGIPRV